MGTNYTTVVYYKGKEMVRQYGQTDGHPTTVIPYLRKFIGTPGNIQHLKRNLQKSFFSNDPPISDELWLRIHNAYSYSDYWPTPADKMRGFINKGFDEQDVFNYILQDRTTRCYILDALTMKQADEAEKIHLWKARTTSTESDGFFAAYNIDLDQKKVFCEWLRHRMEFDFDDFPDLRIIKRFESYELGRNFRLKDWNKFVYVIRDKENGAYHNRAFTNYDRAIRELNALNCDDENWSIYKVRLPWVGRTLCYVSETYSKTTYGHIYSCLAHAKNGSMWAEHLESAEHYPSEHSVSDMEIISRRYNCRCNIERIRVIKEA